ncbi:MAG: alpha/beta fold hydrolase [Bacteroidetes bacterium]|nr:MAG: alpha/beta fold hydrolase [Bacteroidota bacterium]
MINFDVNFNPFFLFKNPHIQTIIPAIFDFIKVNYIRFRIKTPDQDFLDIDTLISNNQNAVVLIHGLEGSSNSHYIKRIAKKTSKTHDVFALNLSGCSGEDNQNLYAYHSGKIADLEVLINYISTNYTYKSVTIIGYSLGANLALKYLGEKSKNTPILIKKCIAISTPLDLSICADIIDNQKISFYKNRFLKSLLNKVERKKTKFNLQFDFENAHKINTIRAFDDWYTAKVNGFANAEDYYQKNSAIGFIEKITIPTFLISAKDDPFLNNSIFIKPQNQLISCIYLPFGGHVGFWSFDFGIKFWIDEKIISLI